MSMTKEGQTATEAIISIGENERDVGGYLRYDVLPALSKEIEGKYLEARRALDKTILAYENLARRAAYTQGLKTLILALGQDGTGGYEIKEEAITTINEVAKTLEGLREKLGKLETPW